MSDDEVFAGTYAVELLCVEPPRVAKRALLASMRRWCPSIEPLDGNDDGPVLSFVHPDHVVELIDATLPAQTFLAPSDEPIDPADYEEALAQTWDFPGARAAVASCRGALVVTDLLSSGLEHGERIDVFHRALRGVLEVVPCVAIHWTRTQRIVSPEKWKTRFDEGDAAFLLGAGALHVRKLELGGDGGDHLMDTLGLGALGLPDIQCHFRGIEPVEVARVLYNTGWYLFEKRDVLADGTTVPGAPPGSTWRCRREESLAPPNRAVIDLEPAAPHAGGHPG